MAGTDDIDEGDPASCGRFLTELNRGGLCVPVKSATSWVVLGVLCCDAKEFCCTNSLMRVLDIGALYVGVCVTDKATRCLATTLLSARQRRDADEAERAERKRKLGTHKASSSRKLRRVSGN